MPEIIGYVDFEVWCDTCGAGLCDRTDVRDGTNIHVEVCPVCIGKKDDEINALCDAVSTQSNELKLMKAKQEVVSG